MENNGKADMYAAEAMFHCKDVEKLLTFLLNAAMNRRCEITEAEVHGAFDCFKARDKWTVELDNNLSDFQKESEKQAIDRFYGEFDRQLTEYMNSRCVVLTHTEEQ